MRPPPGCLQWLTGVNNIFTSFNWDGTPANLNTGAGNDGSDGRLLSEQRYKICFRQEKGMCKIQYSESPIDYSGTGINAFDLSHATAAHLFRGQPRLNAATCGQANMGYLVLNGAEPHINSVGEV